MIPKLSIITINYNNLEGLKRTLESVVNQTWQEFEYIIIDGGSTDGSEQYIESQSAHIDYWVSEPDNGIYNAMNKGIAKATGEYFLFLNSGDHLYSTTVLQENHNEIKSKDLIYFDLEMVGKSNPKIAQYPDILKFSYLYAGSLPHPATFIKAQLFHLVGTYDEKYKIVSDWKFFILALFKYNCNYQRVNKTLSTFYLDGLSSRMDFSDERNEVIDEYFYGFGEDSKELLELQLIVSNLRKSKKIGWLVKLGLIHKF